MTYHYSKKAVVLTSGGLDSATTLAIAKQRGYDCFVLSFDYGQKNRSELTSARNIAKQLHAAEHKILSLDLNTIGGSSLTDMSLDVPVYNKFRQDEIPTTYVPARNTIFLSIALGYAEVVGAESIFIGVNEVDYSGYPDCRPEYIAAFQKLTLLATKSNINGQCITIETPLIYLAKSEIIKQGIELGLDYSKTISCYQADEQGKACGRCDSCYLRRHGFEQAGVADPTSYY